MTMTVKQLMDELVDYDPDMEVHLHLGDAAECYDEIGGVVMRDYSPSAGWFYDEFEDCEDDDCQKVVTIMPKNL